MSHHLLFFMAMLCWVSFCMVKLKTSHRDLRQVYNVRLPLRMISFISRISVRHFEVYSFSILGQCRLGKGFEYQKVAQKKASVPKPKKTMLVVIFVLDSSIYGNYKLLQYIFMAMLKEAAIFTGAAIFLLWLTGAFHVIDSGNIGIYKRGGALLNSWSEPGLHFMIPFLTSYNQVQVTLQTDQVKDIPCGTSSGVVIRFQKIQVVNRLKKELAHQTIKNYTVKYDQTWIFSKIHHEINQFCSSNSLQDVLIDRFNLLDEYLEEALQKGCNQWAPGIQIIAVRVTKPLVPPQISQTYIDREVERTRLLIQKEEQRLISKRSEIEKRINRIKAEGESKVSEINNMILLAEREANKKISSIDNEIMVLQETAYAKGKKYRQQKLIELNKKKLVPQNQLANLLKNIKESKKFVYTQTVGDYLAEAVQIVSDIKSKKKQVQG